MEPFVPLLMRPWIVLRAERGPEKVKIWSQNIATHIFPYCHYPPAYMEA